MSLSDHEMSSVVLANIIKNPWYATKVLPYIESEYFASGTESAISDVILNYYNSHSSVPSVKEIVIELKQLKNINQLDKNAVDMILGDTSYAVNSNDWLLEQTENFIKRKKISLTFADTYQAFDEGEIGEDFAHKFQVASSFQFDNSVGHSLVTDCHVRWEYYTKTEDKSKFYLEMLDLITNGGMLPGTLNLFLAGTGVGKSLVMGDIAAKNALNGKKVLVITLEMAEIRLAERIEANLMDVPVLDLKKMSKSEFTVKQQLYINKLKKSGGDIYFKQYATRTAHAGHFRNLLIEYKNKLDVEFDLIVIDYLNICASQNAPKNSNSYTEIKSIAEELRALAIEFKLPILSATQTNKGGQDSTELSLDNVSESHGLSVTADMLIAIISHEDWEVTGKILFMQLKNRYGPLDFYRKFMVGIDRSKMLLYDLKREASNEMNKNVSANTTNQDVKLDLSVLGKNKVSKEKLNIFNEDKNSESSK